MSLYYIEHSATSRQGYSINMGRNTFHILTILPNPIFIDFTDYTDKARNVSNHIKIIFFDQTPFLSFDLVYFPDIFINLIRTIFRFLDFLRFYQSL